MPDSIELSETAVKELPHNIGRAFEELKTDYKSTFRYLVETEVHVYAFSIAGNVLLSFFPFMLVMIAMCRYFLHWEGGVIALYVAIRDYFPGETGRFLVSNLAAESWRVRSVEWLSLLLLLFTANGVFMPLEVALNRAWGVTSNRSLLKNQAVSTAMIFVCGVLALLSALFTGASEAVWNAFSGGSTPGFLLSAVFKAASVPLTILILFLVYWLLPNAKVPARLILPRAVIVGVCLELLKWVSLAVSPWLFEKFSHEYGPFKNSVMILTWSFLAALVVLAGADWSARRARAAQRAEALEKQNVDTIGAETLPSS